MPDIHSGNAIRVGPVATPPSTSRDSNGIAAEWTEEGILLALRRIASVNPRFDTRGAKMLTIQKEYDAILYSALDADSALRSQFKACLFTNNIRKVET